MSITTFCEQVEITPGIYTYFPYGYVFQTLSEYGPSNNSLIGIWNIGSSNPASTTDFQKAQLSVSYQYKTPAKLDNDFLINSKLEQSNKAIPQAVSLLFPYKSLRFGFSFSSVYSILFSYDPCIHLKNRKEETSVYDGSIILAYDIPIPFQTEDHLSIGCQVSTKSIFYNCTPILTISDKDWSKTAVFWTAGIRYKFQNSYGMENLIGVFYEKGGYISKLLSTDKLELDEVWIYKDYGNALIPNKLHVGISSEIVKQLFIDCNASVLKHNKLIIEGQTFYKDLKDQWEYSASLIYRNTPKFVASIGSFYSENLNTFDGMSVIAYLTSGIKINIQKYDILVSVADSHLFSDKYQQNTIIKFGMGYYL